MSQIAINGENERSQNKHKGKKIKLLTIIKDARDDEYKRIGNLYAKSLGLPPPNILSYEKKNVCCNL